LLAFDHHVIMIMIMMPPSKDVVTDPTEQTEVGASHPEIVSMLSTMRADIAKTIFTADHSNDPACKPFCEAHYGG
jgi:hypothetical protein